MTDTSAITVWLAVIAMASLAQVLLLVGGAFVLARTYRRAMAALEAFERRQLEPLTTRVNATLDEVQDVLDRVKTADDNVRHLIATTNAVAGRAASALGTVWPAVGIGRGVWAAVKSLRRPSTPRVLRARAAARKP